MKHLLFLLLLLQCTFSFAQSQIDTTKLSIGLSSYLFLKNDVYPLGCEAFGPSIFLRDEKLSLQIGLLFDSKTYYIYNGSHMTGYKREEARHAFFPILFHYKYFTTNNLDFILTAGILIERMPQFTLKIYANPIVGTGIEYKFLKRFYFKSNVTVQYTKRIFIPGLWLDLSYSFDMLPKRSR